MTRLDRLDPKETVLVVVDVQERLAEAMPDEQMERVARATKILAEAARLLGATVLVTEQYPKGLGTTIGTLGDVLRDARTFEKMDFSACDVREFSDALDASGARAAVVVGMESHVCVFQTARDLVARGLRVYVPIDGVASRVDDHRETGLRLCEAAGAVRTTAETVAFDWLRRAGSDPFKALSKLIR